MNDYTPIRRLQNTQLTPHSNVSNLCIFYNCSVYAIEAFSSINGHEQIKLAIPGIPLRVPISAFFHVRELEREIGLYFVTYMRCVTFIDSTMDVSRGVYKNV